MPEIVRRNGFVLKVLLPPREHGPPHVHVFKAEGEAVIQLTPLTIREIHGMAPGNVLEAVRLVEEHAAALLAAWRKYHG